MIRSTAFLLTLAAGSVLSSSAQDVYAQDRSGFTNATTNVFFHKFKPGTGDSIAFNADADTAGMRELNVVPLGGTELMTVGARYRVSGSFFTNGMSNDRWVP